VVARHGKPVAILTVPTEQQLVDADIAAIPGIRESLERANTELAEGKAESLDEFVAEVEAEEAAEAAPLEETVRVDETGGLRGSTITVTINSADLHGLSWHKLDPILVRGVVKETLGDALDEAGSISEVMKPLAEEKGFTPEEIRSMIKGAMWLRRAQQRGVQVERDVPARLFGDESLKEIS
jgi:hypothetical protein